MVHFSGTDWFVDPKYKLLNKVGSGAYGFVVAADDVLTGKKVAIKKVANAFEDMIDAKRMLREVRLMRQFNHPNVVKLYDIMEPPYIKILRTCTLSPSLCQLTFRKFSTQR